MRGHSGKSAAPRERQLCGQEALLVAVLDVRLRLGSPPTTSPSPRWRAYMAAGSQRQARCRLFSLISLVIPALSWTTRTCPGRQMGRKNLPTTSCVDALRRHHVYFGAGVGYLIVHVTAESPSYVGYQRYLW